MVEPISMTLTALAMLDPAIKACRKAYGTYKLTASFGEDYRAVQLRLNGQKACLEMAFNTELTIKPDRNVLNDINEQLGNISNHFQSCQDMVAKIEGHLRTPEETLGNAESETQLPVTVTSEKRRKFMLSKPKWLGHKSWGQKYEKNTTSSSSRTEAISLSTLSTAPPLQQSLQGRDPQRAANNQTSASEHLQDAATASVKARWIGQKKNFVARLEDIQISLDLIINMVKLSTLADIRKTVVLPVFSGMIPDDIVSALESLRRLHYALIELNKGGKSSSNHESLVMSIRALKAAGYVQTKEKVQADHDNLAMRENSALYPLQVDFANEKASTMILAETTLVASEPSEQPKIPNGSNSLSQMLCEKDEHAEYSLKAIGSVLTPGSSTDVHELFQDISTSWIVQDTLEGLMRRTKKYWTYVSLAVQIAISYMHFVSIARSHYYPGLSDYRYYNSLPSEKKDIEPEHVLMPFLSVGFGSKAPKKGTREIGGFESQTIDGDEALIRLGLLLHQIGCWTVFEEMDLKTARRTARSKRDDLLIGAAMPFTQVVDLCLGSKDEYLDPVAQAKKIYGTVIVPLQKIVDELRWD